MAGTWMVVVCLLGAAFRFVNAPMVPFLYDHLYRLGLWLFVSHTLVLTLCWKYRTHTMTHTRHTRYTRHTLCAPGRRSCHPFSGQCGSPWACR
jgi:hypothetical protein